MFIVTQGLLTDRLVTEGYGSGEVPPTPATGVILVGHDMPRSQAGQQLEARLTRLRAARKRRKQLDVALALAALEWWD